MYVGFLWFHILVTDGMHDFDETFVQVNDAEKLLLFLRGYPEIPFIDGDNKSDQYD